jgi:hypothetical protein
MSKHNPKAAGVDKTGSLSVALARLAVYVATFVALGAQLSLLAGDTPYNQPVEYHREIRWESSGTSSRALMFWESSAPGAVRRFLIETPGERHLVLTRALLVRHGIEREELRDETTGWTAELIKRIDLRAASLGDFFAKVFADDTTREGKTIELTLRTSDGFSFSETMPRCEEDREEYAKFAEILRREIAATPPVAIPDGLEDALSFLYTALEGEGADSRGLIETLSGALGIATSSTEPAWHQVDGKPKPGVGLVEAESIRFASEFSSVDAMAPLAPGTVDLLAQDERWAEPPGP